MRLLCDRYPTALEFISGREDIDGMSQAVSRPTTAIRKIRTDNNIATGAIVASGKRAARHWKEYQREARRTSIV